MSYCSVQDLRFIFQDRTGGKSGKFRIGNDDDDHLDTTSAEFYIEMAQTEIDNAIRKDLPTGDVPLVEPVVNELRFATAFLACNMIAESNYFGQRNINDEGVGKFFKDRADSFVLKFISNYNAGVYGSTYSGVTYGPQEGKPDSTDYTCIPPFYRRLFFNYDVG